MSNDSMLKEEQYKNGQVVDSLLETVKDLIGYLQDLKVLISEGKDSNYLIGYINQSIKTGNFGLSTAREIINSGLNESNDKKQNKFNKVMGEFGKGTLKTSAGDKVTDRKQALAIAYSESGLDEECNNNINENKQQKTMNKNKNSIRIKEFELKEMIKSAVVRILKEDVSGGTEDDKYWMDDNDRWDDLTPYDKFEELFSMGGSGFSILETNGFDYVDTKENNVVVAIGVRANSSSSSIEKLLGYLKLYVPEIEIVGRSTHKYAPELRGNIYVGVKKDYTAEEAAENDYNEYHKNRLTGVSNESKKPNKLKIKESVLRDLVKNTITKVLKEDFDGEEVEPFVAHGTYTLGNAGGYEIMLSNDGDAARVRDAFGSDEPETSDWLPIEYVNDEETGELEPVIDPEGYNIPLNMVMRTRRFGTNESKKQKNKTKRLSEDVDDDLISFIVPKWATTALINGDESGLSDEDSESLNKFQNRVYSKFGNAHFLLGDIDGEDDLGFQVTNDVDRFAGDCYRLYIKPNTVGESKKVNKIRIKESELVDLIRRVVLSETTKHLKEDDSDGSNKYSVKYTFEGEPYSFEKTGLNNAIGYAKSMSTKHGVNVSVCDKSSGKIVKKIKFNG